MLHSRAQPAAHVALIDDHALFREGLRVVIGQVGGLEVTAEAATVRDALGIAARVALDIAVVDVTLPDGSGASVTRELRRLQPRCKVLVLSMIEEPYQVAELLRAGASGYALKSQPTDEILEAIRAVLAGEHYLAPRLPCAHVEDLVAAKTAGPLDKLSPREREIFDLLVRGQTNDRIAAQLYISVRTVETHRQNIMDKLQTHSIVDLVRLAARHGLIQD